MAKMHQILYLLGLRPRPRWGSSQRSPDPLPGFKGPTSKREEGREGEGKGRRRKGPKGREKEPPFQNVCVRACHCRRTLHYDFIGNV